MASIFSIFKRGLEKSSTKIGRTVGMLFGKGEAYWNENTFQELEDTLISYDFGVAASTKIIGDIRDRYERGKIKSSEDVYQVARDTVAEILNKNQRQVNLAEAGKPTVILFVGVNGSGKTTTVGKLANLLQKSGKKVILGSCDTFRAAACEQLALWSERSKVDIVSAQTGADPASVAFDATQAALNRNADYLLIDTAGRQHNQKNLMDELAKIRRTIQKVYPEAPHEVWLTVDASIGSNVLNQAKNFSACCDLTGIVLTKLDGSGRGGMAVALKQEFNLPCFYAGLGEQPEDLQEFNADFYAQALFDNKE